MKHFKSLVKLKRVVQVMVILLSFMLIGVISGTIIAKTHPDEEAAATTYNYVFRIFLEDNTNKEFTRYYLTYNKNTGKVYGNVPSAVGSGGKYYYLNQSIATSGLLYVEIDYNDYSDYTYVPPLITGAGDIAWTFYDVVYYKLRYSIVYNANGGNTNSVPSAEVKIHGENYTISTKIPTRTGYNFKYWTTNQDGSGFVAPGSEGPLAPGNSYGYAPGGTYTANENTTFYAQWERITYKLYFYGNKPSGAAGTINNMPRSPQTYNYGDTVILSTVPTLDGYVFAFWMDDYYGEHRPGDRVKMQENKYFTAQWYKIYTITVLVNDPVKGTVDKTTIKVPCYSKIKYDNNTLKIINSVTEEVIVVTATSSPSSTSTYSYVFDNWYNSNYNSVGTIDYNHTVYDDVTITAQFSTCIHKEIKFTASPNYGYFTQNGTRVTSVYVPLGSSVSYSDSNRTVTISGTTGTITVLANANSSSDGGYTTYSFSYWSNVPTNPVTGNTTIYAHFTMEQRYAVRYNPNGETGSVINKGYKNYSQIFEVESPEILGYSKTRKITFNTNISEVGTIVKTVSFNMLSPEWRENNATTGQQRNIGYKYQNTTGLKTLYAQWEYTATYDLEDIIDQISAISQEVHKTFLGWSTTDGGAVEYAPDGDVEINNDTILYAVWASTLTIRFDNNSDFAAVEIKENGREKEAVSREYIVTTCTLTRSTDIVGGDTTVTISFKTKDEKDVVLTFKFANSHYLKTTFSCVGLDDGESVYDDMLTITNDTDILIEYHEKSYNVHN